MTDSTEKTKTPKLKLGGGKLKLRSGGAAKRTVTTSNTTSSNSGQKSSTLVVEVKRGKAQSLAGNNTILTSQEPSSSAVSQDKRRMNALKNAEEASRNTQGKSSLSKIAELNAELQAQEAERDAALKKLQVEKEAEEQRVVSEQNAKQQAADAKASPNSTDKAKASKALKVSKPVAAGAGGSSTNEEEQAKAVKNTLKPEPRKLKKSEIFNLLEDKDPVKARSLASIQRAKEKQRRKQEMQKPQEKIYRTVLIPEAITVAELASRMSERATDVVKELMKLGVMASGSQSVDAETAELIVTTFGHTPKIAESTNLEESLIEEDAAKDLMPRAPVVTVMGHVDHGKTSLLDALKQSDVVGGEAGGITQHIGAYTIKVAGDKMVTFIDTPGHEAFSAMRTRGAKITDIVILVVAADDGIKTQTIEAINHAKAAEVPIIVAINKMDKEGADPARVKTELLNHELIAEDLGGDIMTVEVSALQRTNLDQLIETILLQSEIMDLKANPNAKASGVVIESRVDKGQGAIATVLVQRGQLRKGDLVVAGTTYGRVRKMCNDKGQNVSEAGPSVAVELYGLGEAAGAGDMFNVASSDKQARDIVEYREKNNKDSKVTAVQTSLDDLFSKASGKTKVKDFAIIIKGDVHGSIEAISASINKIENKELNVKVLHSAVGAITESDISLAAATGAMVVGFNVRANSAAKTMADKEGVDVRYYSIIYDLMDDIKLILSGMLSPIIRENYIGSVEIRQVFNITKIGKIAGSYVTKGIIKKGAGVRLLRDDVVIHEGKLKTLKRFKDEVKEVREGYECGIAFERYEDIKEGDTVEVYEIVEEKRQL